MNNQEIPQYEITYSRIKNIYIKIKDGKVLIKAPKRVSKKELTKIIEEKSNWIQKSLEKEKKNSEKKPQYTQEQFKQLVEKNANELIEITGLIPNRIRIRKIKYAWGSCSINKNITITEGMNHMNVEEALAFARERHAYSTGDRHRGENQQAIITAMINKLADVSNITKYKDILSSLDGTFETSMSYEELTNLFKLQIDKKINWDISSISLDGSGSMQKTYSMGNRNLYVMIPNEASVSDAKVKIDEYMKK